MGNTWEGNAKAFADDSELGDEKSCRPSEIWTIFLQAIIHAHAQTHTHTFDMSTVGAVFLEEISPFKGVFHGCMAMMWCYHSPIEARNGRREKWDNNWKCPCPRCCHRHHRRRHRCCDQVGKLRREHHKFHLQTTKIQQEERTMKEWWRDWWKEQMSEMTKLWWIFVTTSKERWGHSPLMKIHSWGSWTPNRHACSWLNNRQQRWRRRGRFCVANDVVILTWLWGWGRGLGPFPKLCHAIGTHTNWASMESWKEELFIVVISFLMQCLRLKVTVKKLKKRQYHY